MRVLKEILGDQFPVDGNLLRPGPKPLFTDIEVLALSVTAEAMGIDSECYLFAKLMSDYKTDFPHLISRRQYNDRRKILFQYQEIIRGKIAGILNAITEVYAADSMPLEICKLSRMERNKMGKEEPYISPDKGYCASQDKWYYGYKLHSVCAPNGVIQALDLTKASIHDNNFLFDIAAKMKNCMVIGDKGYIVNPADAKALALQESAICMSVPTRTNQKEQKPQIYLLKSIRKRIETVFSQLCDQFMIQRNYAKSFTGYKTRILAKISSMTLLQYINKFIRNKPVGQVKYALCY